MSLLKYLNSYDFLFIYLISILFIVFMYQLFYIEDPYDDNVYIDCYDNLEMKPGYIY
jgi:hypothetical protein